ncbi:MAG: HD domain-containing protein [Candidatus Marinimicrobia bacterium]|nr:HD domain-containing protein [Candidatus Neomarinimicrobiota bacterium]
MKAILSIDQFTEGNSIQGFYLCIEKHIRITRTKDQYLDLVLRDRTGQISAKIWDKVDEYRDKFEAGDPVAVSGNVDMYLDRQQLVVKKINRASVQYYGRYGYDPALIVPASEYDPNELWKNAVEIIRSINNSHLKSLVSKIYKTHKDRIMIHPASVMMHHNYRSGFLEHILSMAKVAQHLAGHYDVDYDLLLAGVFLHDIGKLREIESDLEIEYTTEGNFIGHIVLGRDMVRESASTLNAFPQELLQKLDHMILAHQGRYEWQSPVRPKIKEALLLHYIDNMDAKLNLFDKAIEEDHEPGEWTDRRNYFRLNLFKGDHDG